MMTIQFSIEDVGVNGAVLCWFELVMPVVAVIQHMRQMYDNFPWQTRSGFTQGYRGGSIDTFFPGNGLPDVVKKCTRRPHWHEVCSDQQDLAAKRVLDSTSPTLPTCYPRLSTNENEINYCAAVDSLPSWWEYGVWASKTVRFHVYASSKLRQSVDDVTDRPAVQNLSDRDKGTDGHLHEWPERYLLLVSESEHFLVPVLRSSVTTNLDMGKPERKLQVVSNRRPLRFMEMAIGRHGTRERKAMLFVNRSGVAAASVGEWVWWGCEDITRTNGSIPHSQTKPSLCGTLPLRPTPN
ncbi:hypothetical protein BC629DRAFT_1434397 [Irpex lacteus]|nr:hypothetical protein BC629DRAFT_1434397 [Irpex lacteus]